MKSYSLPRTDLTCGQWNRKRRRGIQEKHGKEQFLTEKKKQNGT